MDLTKFSWTRQPECFRITAGTVEIVTKPHTDLWQRTYYHFRNDNAPVFQMETEEQYFSFVVKTEFADSHHRFDQCGIVMYLDSENWLKGSIEYENDEYQHLGSVVTNEGWSDWATTVIPADVKSMWYRSAGERTIIVSNALRMESISGRCVSAICIKGKERSGSASMPARRKNRHLKRYSRIWN